MTITIAQLGYCHKWETKITNANDEVLFECITLDYTQALLAVGVWMDEWSRMY